MKNKPLLIAGAGAAIIAIILLAKKAQGGEGECSNCQGGNIYYYATWMGQDTYLPNAFGPAWSVIFIVEKYFPLYGWDQISSDPENYLLHHGEEIRFQLQADAQVCGFDITLVAHQQG